MLTKAIVTSSPGSVDLPGQLLLGNNAAETIIVMGGPPHLGLLAVAVAVAATITEAINRVATAVLLVEVLLHGSDSKTLHHLLQAVSTAVTVDIPEGMVIPPVHMEGSREWELPRAWEVVLVVSVLHQVLVHCSRTMVLMAPPVVLHLHLLRMISLHR